MLPKTKMGWRAIELGAGFWGSFGLWQWLSNFNVPGLSIPLVIAGLCESASVITGMIAIFVEKDRAVTVIITTMWGMLVTVFAMGEIISQHLS